MAVAEFGLAHAWLIVAFPAVGTLLLLGSRRTDRWGHWFAALMSGASAACALLVLLALLGRPHEDRSHRLDLFGWMSVGTFDVRAGLLVDPLSVTFVLLITVVGTLIHVYSVGYLRDDPRRRRFFAYLNLFLVAMLLLVLADNYLLLYVGWEGVGLASYLLIGFWEHKPSAATAAKKAFVVNRVGDLGLLVAVMTMFAAFGSVGFAEVFARTDTADPAVPTMIGLLLLLGACGKSAQVPLQTWLLDAMEGPTPVSALIHAATMVTAGVYLIVRSHPLFDAAPAARAAVVVVGALTMLVGAVIGCAKHDIKKALAASTMSQIGYMVLAAGLGAAGSAAAILHLVTHGFFKAGLFLGAGSVMHGMHDEIDMRRYGGLAPVMPVTFATFGTGYLAIIGIPPFAGFFSKEQVIEVAAASGWGHVLGPVTVLGAGLTAFYMTRVMVLTFFGTRRWAAGASPHESPPVMTVPMVVVALGSAGAGFLLVRGNALGEWLAPVVGAAPVHHDPAGSGLPLTAVVLAAVGCGCALAVAAYRTRGVVDRAAGARPVSRLTRAAREGLYADALNEVVFVRLGGRLTAAAAWVERSCVDRVVTGVGDLVGGTGQSIRRVQTGFARSYALLMVLGAVLLLGATLLIGGPPA